MTIRPELQLKNSFTLFTLCIIAFAAFTSFSFLFPIIPLYAAELGAPVSQVGLIVAATAYVTAFFLVPMGMLSDKFGRRNLLVGSLVVFTLAPLLYPLATNPQQLILVRAIHGLAVAAFWPAATALVVDLTPESKRGEAIGWYTASPQLGLTAGPIAGGFFSDYFGSDAAFYCCSVISLVGLVLILSRFGAFFQKPVDDLAGGSSWSWMKQRLAFAGLLTSLFIASGLGTIVSYIPLYGKDLSITKAGAGLIITAIYASSALLQVPSGRLSDRVDRKLLLIGGLGLGAVAVSQFFFFYSLWQLIIVAVVFGISMGLAMPAIFAMIADLSPAGARGQSMAMVTCFYQVGFAAGPTVMGFVAEMTNFETMFLACAFSLIFGLLVIVGLMRAR
jgi:DHA1 family multidrug resistance protein-like MFS transporter